MSSTDTGPWWWFSPWSRRDFRRKSRRESHSIKLPRSWQRPEDFNMLHHYPNFHHPNLQIFGTDLFMLQNPTCWGITSTAMSHWGNFGWIAWDAEHEPVGDPPNTKLAPQSSRERHRCAKNSPRLSSGYQNSCWISSWEPRGHKSQGTHAAPPLMSPAAQSQLLHHSKPRPQTLQISSDYTNPSHNTKPRILNNRRESKPHPETICSQCNFF